MFYDQQQCQKLMDFLFVFPSRNYRDVSGMRVTTLQTMRRKPPAYVRRDRSARTGEPQRSVSCALPRSLIHSFCRLPLLISDETVLHSGQNDIYILMAHSHCTGQGQGPGNDGFLYYAIYCSHYTGTGTGTGNHCFLLYPSRSRSLSRSRSRAV